MKLSRLSEEQIIGILKVHEVPVAVLWSCHRLSQICRGADASAPDVAAARTNHFARGQPIPRGLPRRVEVTSLQCDLLSRVQSHLNWRLRVRALG